MPRAPSSRPILASIAERYSPRAFDSTADLSVSDLATIFEAGSWAASGGNGQPWRWVLTRAGSARHQELVGCFDAGNQRWIGAAPVLGVVCAATLTSRGKPNAHAWFDAGLAFGTLSVQAASMGIMLHPMAGLDRAKAGQVLGVPGDVDVVAGFTMGRAANPAVLPDDLRAREQAPRVRKPLSELLFLDQWQTPLVEQ